MPKHRGLSLKTFTNSIPFDLFERYFDQLKSDAKPSPWVVVNRQALEAFLAAPENAEAAAMILEDLKRINDICAGGMSLVVRAYDRFGLEVPSDTPATELAMRLFLDHRDAFEFAWTRYLLYGSPSRLTFHHLDTEKLNIEDEAIQAFALELQRWFGSLAKGLCRVRHFRDGNQTVILISRGSYMRTIACWQGEEIAFTAFRPASEDVIVYDPVDSELIVKASLPKDREQYLRTFANCVAGDVSVAEIASQHGIFSLIPLQDGTFNFAGDGTITRIDLVKARLKLIGPNESVIEIKSEDVLESLRGHLKGLALAQGELTLARFRFHLHPPGEHPVTVTFEVEPPGRTDLAQKRYADIIERYLVEEGVRK